MLERNRWCHQDRERHRDLSKHRQGGLIGQKGDAGMCRGRVLCSFYVDPSRPFGVNNIVFPSVGMPHVLEELQGIPTPIYDLFD